MISYKEHIEISTDRRFGKPIIKNTRISVYDVLGWLANGMSIADILTDFPELRAEDIQACLAYAADKEHKILIAS